ncbi:TPA: hypothetical protein DEW47_01295 [Patescibacteria group bacterium]|nr:MAG: hypothetical protein UT71_C0005G0024 [Parcubacteria group bacterium GW2011_GWF2_40_10]KKR47933.1 MAG: hypothetical protein UT83_C0002G0064 [Parcubacteria group bacterium GW2011_GWA2_40_143]KKR60381.1 MAG: hypothetical protein UT97_C0002G0081 [Parcubacteria group bacterium GW2011_GWC2_40_31]KKR75269.1 MAG: hypothetical protein UU18_C0009G0010 [Parcubacteria group bacterium GW2011_GWB2_40_8]KKR76665.1 MAG: hypothetical protein UU20_C0021G0009 [Parcubacteria group bacterium GW2011_GWE2_40_
MKKLPSLKAKDVVRILKKLGFEEDRQKGSHLILIFTLFTIVMFKESQKFDKTYF